jgi:hypothetical protein
MEKEFETEEKFVLNILLGSQKYNSININIYEYLKLSKEIEAS